MAEQPSLGSAIKEVRTIRGLTQSDLALAASVTENYVSIVERGDRSLSTPKLEAVAEALGLSPSELTALGTNEMSGKAGKLLAQMKKVIIQSIKCDAED